MADFSSIISLLRQEKVTLFLGAGFSFKAGGPKVWQLTESLKPLFPSDLQDRISSLTLSDMTEEYCQVESRQALLKWLRKQLDFTPTDLSDHVRLTKIPHFHRIFTTNYDTLLEDNYGGKCTVIRTNTDVANSQDGKVQIFKIHGDFVNPEDILITKSDYFGFYRDRHNPLMWEVVKAEFIQHPILFIGYSLDDDNVSFLLDSIHKETNGIHQPIFLIAPNMHEYKVRRLETFGVQYFNAYAEDFLKKVDIVLRDTIVKDHEHKLVSDDTFQQFMIIHNLAVQTISSSESNKLHRVDFGDGELRHSVINFKVNAVKGELIKRYKFSENIYSPELGVSIPSIKICHNELLSFKAVSNGVTFFGIENLEQFLVQPPTEVHDCAIRIMGSRFYKKVKIVTFSLKSNERTLKIGTDSCEITLTFAFKPDEHCLNFNFTFELKEQFSNLNEAIDWLELPRAIGNHKQISIYGVNSQPIEITAPNEVEQNPFFEEMAKYYRLIEEVECAANICFKHYPKYSEDNCSTLINILSFIKQGSYNCTVGIGSTAEFSLNDVNWPYLNSLEVGTKTYALDAVRPLKEPIVFGSEAFSVPYEHTIFPKVTILKKEIIDNEKVDFKIRVETDTVTKCYTKQHSQDGITLKPLPYEPDLLL